MASVTLTVVDNRTGKTYEIQIHDGSINAVDLRQIKASESLGNCVGIVIIRRHHYWRDNRLSLFKPTLLTVKSVMFVMPVMFVWLVRFV